MNVFACDAHPRRAAYALPDKLLVKMCTETAQILCTVLRQHGVDDTPYRSTHPKHPVVKWAAASRGNFDWLLAHGDALCDAYTERYARTHKSHEVILWCVAKRDAVPDCELTQFAQAMPEEFQNPDDPIDAYRRYLQAKPYAKRWKLAAHKPSWWTRELGPDGQ